MTVPIIHGKKGQGTEGRDHTRVKASMDEQPEATKTAIMFYFTGVFAAPADSRGQWERNSNRKKANSGATTWQQAPPTRPLH